MNAPIIKVVDADDDAASATPLTPPTPTHEPDYEWKWLSEPKAQPQQPYFNYSAFERIGQSSNTRHVFKVGDVVYVQAEAEVYLAHLIGLRHDPSYKPPISPMRCPFRWLHYRQELGLPPRSPYQRAEEDRNCDYPVHNVAVTDHIEPFESNTVHVITGHVFAQTTERAARDDALRATLCDFDRIATVGLYADVYAQPTRFRIIQPLELSRLLANPSDKPYFKNPLPIHCPPVNAVRKCAPVNCLPPAYSTPPVSPTNGMSAEARSNSISPPPSDSHPVLQSPSPSPSYALPSSSPAPTLRFSPQTEIKHHNDHHELET